MSSAPLPPRCLHRLTRELKMVEEQKADRLKEHGVELSLSDPDGEDLRVWTLRVHTSGVDAKCALGVALRTVRADAIEFEMVVPPSFPVAPPMLRVIRPRFQRGSFFVQQHGALCLEILSAQGWTPAMSLPQLGVQVKAMMSQGGGHIADLGTCGDPGPEGRERAWAVMRQIESIHQDWNKFSGV